MEHRAMFGLLKSKLYLTLNHTKHNVWILDRRTDFGLVGETHMQHMIWLLQKDWKNEHVGTR